MKYNLNILALAVLMGAAFGAGGWALYNPKPRVFVVPMNMSAEYKRAVQQEPYRHEYERVGAVSKELKALLATPIAPPRTTTVTDVQPDAANRHALKTLLKGDDHVTSQER